METASSRPTSGLQKPGRKKFASMKPLANSRAPSRIGGDLEADVNSEGAGRARVQSAPGPIRARVLPVWTRDARPLSQTLARPHRAERTALLERRCGSPTRQCAVRVSSPYRSRFSARGILEFGTRELGLARSRTLQAGRQTASIGSRKALPMRPRRFLSQCRRRRQVLVDRCLDRCQTHV